MLIFAAPVLPLFRKPSSVHLVEAVAEIVVGPAVKSPAEPSFQHVLGKYVAKGSESGKEVMGVHNVVNVTAVVQALLKPV